jgi:hypothetical protein
MKEGIYDPNIMIKDLEKFGTTLKDDLIYNWGMVSADLLVIIDIINKHPKTSPETKRIIANSLPVILERTQHIQNLIKS